MSRMPGPPRSESRNSCGYAPLSRRTSATLLDESDDAQIFLPPSGTNSTVIDGYEAQPKHLSGMPTRTKPLCGGRCRPNL
jgi:hypothetical protein